MDFYISKGAGEGTLLGALLSFLRSLAPSEESADFLSTVLFGGTLASIYSLLQFIFAPIWGRLSDRIGRRPVLIGTLMGTIFGYGLWIFADAFAVLLLSRIITGITGGNLSVATASIADVTTTKTRTKGIALVGVAFGLGFILGPAIGGFSGKINLLAEHPEWAQYGINPFSVPAMVACALACCNLFWVFKRFRETLDPEHRNQTSEERSIFSRFFGIISIPNAQVRFTGCINFLYILSSSGMEFSVTFLAVERLGFTPAENGMMFFYMGVIMILAQGVFVRRLSAYIPEKFLVVIGLSCSLTAFFTLSQASELLFFGVGLTFLAMGAGLTSPCMTALASLYTTPEKQGEYLGIFRSTGSLARAFGPTIGALAYFYFGSHSAYVFGGCFLLIPFSMVFSLPRPKLHIDIKNQELAPEPLE
ncbi:MAG TPA: MFS transporter [Opitutae bacterium]|nr:MFS transporter [Opitutae bacterium]